MDRRRCAEASRGRAAGTNPGLWRERCRAGAAPSSSAPRASAGTRPPRQGRARSGRRPSCRRSATTSSSTISDRRRNSAVIGVRGYGVGCWMYGQSTYRRANARFASIDSRVSSGLPTISPPTTKSPCRCRCPIAAIDALPTVRPSARCAFLADALRKARSVGQHVLDAEEHVAEPGAPHQRRERGAVLGERRRHRLDDVVGVVEAALDDRLAQPLEPPHVERDVVVHQEDGPGAVSSWRRRCRPARDRSGTGGSCGRASR